MVAHKNRLLLYGGFYDTGRELKYYNDLWSFDFESLKWSPVNDSGSGGKAQRLRAPIAPCPVVMNGDALFQAVTSQMLPLSNKLCKNDAVQAAAAAVSAPANVPAASWRCTARLTF